MRHENKIYPAVFDARPLKRDTKKKMEDLLKNSVFLRCRLLTEQHCLTRADIPLRGKVKRRLDVNNYLAKDVNW